MNPSLEKIEEDLQDFLSQYLFDFVDTKEEVSNEINDYLNCIYVTENVVYIKEVSENEDVSSTVSQRDQSHFEAKVEIPLYSGGKNYSFYKEKKALKVSSELEFQDAKNKTKKDATNAWSEYQLKKSELDLARAQLKAAEIAYEGIVQEYESGTRDTLDVLNSRSLLLDASLNFTDVEQEEILSRFKLLQVTGNLTSLYLELEAKQIEPKTNWIRHIF